MFQSRGVQLFFFILLGEVQCRSRLRHLRDLYRWEKEALFEIDHMRWPAPGRKVYLSREYPVPDRPPPLSAEEVAELQRIQSSRPQIPPESVDSILYHEPRRQEGRRKDSLQQEGRRKKKDLTRGSRFVCSSVSFCFVVLK